MTKPIQSPAKIFQRQFNWVLAFIVTAAAVFLHLVFLNHAGGLWRDEAGVVSVATLPASGEMWNHLGDESFPVFFPAVIRFWSAIGFGNTDFGLRTYGFVVSLLLLGAVWFNGWALNRSVPLISLGLLAVNATVVRWGDSLRGYGIGSVLMLMTVALVWRFVAVPSRRRWVFALLAALASVQCLFQNAFLLVAVCIAGGAVCLRRKDVKNVVAVLAIGLIAALSFIPYLRIIHDRNKWSALLQTGYLPGLIWQKFSDAVDSGMPWAKWLWIGLGLLAVFRWAKIFGQRAAQKNDPETPAVLFATTALVAGAAIFFIYLRLAALPTQVWYYLPLITFAAVCLDAALANWHPRFQIARWFFLGVMVVIPFAKTYQSVQYRQTNIDLIAEVLREQAGPDDLILLHPWYFGVSFDRYYRGKTPWTTLPELADHRWHRYDLFKAKMALPNPIQPVLDQIAATLQSGHRVWIVGWVTFTKRPPPDPGPPPNQFYGWQDEACSQAWGASAGYLLATHVEQSDRIPVPCPNAVADFENLPLRTFVGWHEAAPAKAAN